MVYVKGFNSDICHQGCSYHVQTEDWGATKSAIVTKVFKNGAVVKTITSSYKDFIRENLDVGPNHHTGSKTDHIRSAMQTQHKEILTQLFQ